MAFDWPTMAPCAFVCFSISFSLSPARFDSFLNSFRFVCILIGIVPGSFYEYFFFNQRHHVPHSTTSVEYHNITTTTIVKVKTKI